MLCTDNETGEIEKFSLYDDYHYDEDAMNIDMKYLDMETGEINNDKNKKLQLRKPKFSIPKSYLRNDLNKKEKCCLSNSKETYSLTTREKVMNLKEEIILGYNKTSHRLFLIPSLFLFPKLVVIFISIMEVFLHIWAHKKNSTNCNEGIFYRSPLHVLTSEFCGICRTHSETEKVRRLHSNFLNVARNIS